MYKNRKTLIFLLIIILFLNIKSSAQYERTCNHAYMLVKTAEKFHYNPRELNDDFAELVFTRMIEVLDYSRLLFTQEDIESLEQIKLEIDENIKNKRSDFLLQLTLLYIKRLAETDSTLLKFNNKEFDYYKKDSLSFKKENRSLNKSGLFNNRKKVLKFKTLLSCLPNNDSTLITKNDFSTEKLSRIKTEVISRESCKLNSKYQDISETNKYLSSVYLNAISFAFDPHTSYFSEEEKKEFEAYLSEENESFGLELSFNERDQVIIENIYPGSPAWNSNQINKGDVILKITLPDGTEKKFDCTNLEKAMKTIASAEIKEANFHIQKKNRSKIDVSLIKKRISVADNVINSFILDGHKKIGYINLPTFYSQFDSISYLPNGCANDIAKEIIKLKREGIEGLVFDLRNNGGGSMLEAIRLSGIFVDYGAIGIMHSRNTKPLTLKDMERGLVFNAPLVILINSYSASASEFFAAAMQDYNRAVIVGSKSFGKSTAQTIIPIESYKNDAAIYTESKEGAYLKLTSGKFYRVTGKSHQKEGVIPDLELYEVEAFYSEENFLSSLENTAIDKKTYYFPWDSLPINELKIRSEVRLKSEKNTINHRAIGFLTERNRSIPIDIISFIEFYNDKIRRNKREAVVNPPYKVNNIRYIKGFQSITDSDSEINEGVMNNIKKDKQIIETYYIINDLIELKNNQKN